MLTNLNKQRFAKGYTLRRLAAEAGIAFNTVASYESGRRDINKARIDTLLKLADVLKVPVHYILEDEQANKMRELENYRRRL